MDGPYSWSSSRPRYPSYVRGVPVHHHQTKSPKVISIPVHFIGSGKSRSDAALKIQKVFRGFLARKNLRKIAAIRREVDEIDQRISPAEVAQLIERHPMERLKVNEMLMAILFRLDSVPGIDSGVRDCRKALIKRTISLQERLDAIVAGDNSTVDTRDGEETQIQALDTADCTDSPSFTCRSVSEVLGQTLDAKESANSLGSCEGMVNRTLETKDLAESLDESRTLGDAADQARVACSVDSGDREPLLAAAACQNIKPQASDESRDDGDTAVEALNKADRKVHASEESDDVTGKDADTKAENVLESSGCSHQSIVEEGQGENLKGLEDVKETNSVPNICNVRNLDGSPSVEDREKHGDNHNKTCHHNEGRGLTERIMEDNERLMGLMTELLERNELQTRLISSLSHRVEQLERAFVSERLKRKKRRQAAAVTVERQDTATDPRKCVKKSS